ncbi:MAG: right-handed parallel beta-helix repeat-containing protein [Alteromonadales bacterium]|nr:right-handed parallel beta-helix repeat-containing protein [Alteromonadales bacterium]
MAITKLQADAKGTAGNSTGADVKNAVNALIDNSSYQFDTVALMKASTDLVAGDLVKTLGYHTKGDAGKALYVVKTAAQAATDNDVIDGFGNLPLSNSLKAVLFDANIIYPYVFGAGFGSDDTSRLVAAHDKGKSVDYMGGSYIVKDTNKIKVYDGVSYIGNGATITAPTGTVATDAGDNFGKFNNSLFYRHVSTPMLEDITISGFAFKIDEPKCNAVGAADISNSDRDLCKGRFVLYSNTSVNAGIANGGGGNATAGFNAGSFFSSVGLSVHIHHNTISDSGNGIEAINGLRVRIHDNDISNCGVSSDMTTWSNVGAIVCRGSKIQHIHDNHINKTGGTAIFSSSAGSAAIESVTIVNNTVAGSGLSAISAGFRASATGTKITDLISIEGNKISGFNCGVDADLHSGVSVAIEDGNNSKIKKVVTSNIVDFVAPWESFNTATNQVDNSVNTKKLANSLVGAQYCVRVDADSTDGIAYAESKDTVLNNKRMGYLFRNIDTLLADNCASNIGWERLANNTATVTNQSLVMESIGVATTNCSIVNQSRGVTAAANAYCTPILATNVKDHTLDAACSMLNSQNRALRVKATTTGQKLKIINLDIDNPQFDAGFRYVLDDSSGANTKDISIKWLTSKEKSVVTGSRTLPAGHSAIKKGVVSPVTITLNPARFYDADSIEFIAEASSSLVITPFTAETVDGVTGDYTIPAGQRKTLLSKGGAWLVL